MKVRIWRRVRVLLLLDGGHTVRGTAIAVGGYPREISRVAKRYLRGFRPRPESGLSRKRAAPNC